MKFRYNRDKRVKWYTAVYWVAIVAAVAAVVLFAQGGYLQAWLLSLLTAILLLYVLSIPRYVKVDADALEIHCVVEMTRIEIRDIASIRKVEKKKLGRLFLLLGSYGFFGYFGYYFDIRNWDLVKVYITEWRHRVEIEDIYEQRYLISCRGREELIDAVMQAKLLHAGDDYMLPEEDKQE